MAAGRESVIGIGFASPKRLSARISPIAPASFARSAFEAKRADAARRRARSCRSAIQPGSVPADVFGSVAEPQRCESTGFPSVPITVLTSTIVWSSVDQAAGRLAPPAPWIGTAPSDGGPPVTESAGANTCEFDVAATAIASGATPGEPAVPKPKSSRSLPAAITGTTPASVTLWIVSNIASFDRVGLRAAAGEVDDVHPVRDRRLERVHDLRRRRLVAERRGNGEDAVVADPRLRRDAREVRDSGMVGPAGAFVPSSPAAIPETCVPCGSVGSKAFELFLSRSSGRGTTLATITFGVVFVVSPFGKPGG